MPPLASADDAEPPSPDELGAFWLSRATQSERSFSEGDLDIDLENVADVREVTEPDEYEYDDEELTSPDRGAARLVGGTTPAFAASLGLFV